MWKSSQLVYRDTFRMPLSQPVQRPGWHLLCRFRLTPAAILFWVVLGVLAALAFGPRSEGVQEQMAETAIEHALAALGLD